MCTYIYYFIVCRKDNKGQIIVLICNESFKNIKIENLTDVKKIVGNVYHGDENARKAETKSCRKKNVSQEATIYLHEKPREHVPHTTLTCCHPIFYNNEPFQFDLIQFQNPKNNTMADSPHYQLSTKPTQVLKAATAVISGGSLLILSGLILAGTVISLTIATPLFVIFSPVLVPAVITVALLTLGFFAFGGFGVAAMTVLAWIYKYVTGEHPPGADQLDTARHKLMNKAREIKDYGQQQISGTQTS